MIELVPFVVLAFAAFRMTRFLLFDTLIDEPRDWMYRRIAGGNKFRYLREKLLDLTSCSWCAGVWICLALYSIYVVAFPWEFTRYNWLSLLGIAGAQGMLHSYEPSDD